MDHLEDLVGKEEAEKISHKATEPAISGVPPTAALVQQQNESSLSGYHNNHPFQQQQQQQPEFKQQLQSQQQSQQPLSQPTQQQLQESNVNSFLPSSSNNNSLGSGSQGYSIWTSKSIATLSSAGRTRDSSLTLSEGKGNEDSSLISSSSSSVSRNNTGGGDDTGSQSRPSSVAPLPLVTCPDDIIPFADTPHISRFGPISRKAGTPFHSAQPSQTQAVISDEPTMTAVVRHSKQLTRQVPTMAALYHQNGAYSNCMMACGLLENSSNVGGKSMIFSLFYHLSRLPYHSSAGCCWCQRGNRLHRCSRGAARFHSSADPADVRPAPAQSISNSSSSAKSSSSFSTVASSLSGI